jgi:thioredoxin 1
MELTSAQFSDTIKNSEVPVLVDFYADWCGPCRRIAPLINEISNETEGKALVYKVNVDDNQDLAAKYSVMSIPCVISFLRGEPHKRVVGAASKADFLALLD